MKKKMLKIFVSVFVIVVLCAAFAGCERGGDTSRFAIEKAEFVTTYDVVTMTREISEKHPDRTSGSEAETTQGGGDYDVLAAGGAGGYAQNDYIFLNEYVAPKMNAMGYLGGIEQFRFRRFQAQRRLQRSVDKGGGRREQGRDMDRRGI